MPAGGVVTVEVSPFQAHSIVWWLEGVEREQHSTRLGLLAEVLSKLCDQHDVASLIAKFRKVIQRKRAGGPFKRVTVQLSRLDATWLANKGARRGMLGRAVRPLPLEVQLLAHNCLQAVNKKRGRKKLEREQLGSSLARQHLDERHRKRLRRRQREEAARQEMIANYGRILEQAIIGSEKSA